MTNILKLLNISEESVPKPEIKILPDPIEYSKPPQSNRVKKALMQECIQKYKGDRETTLISVKTSGVLIDIKLD